MVLQVNMALMHQNTFIKDVCRKDNQKRRKTISVTQATTADPHHSTQPAQYIGMVHWNAETASFFTSPLQLTRKQAALHRYQLS